MFLFDKIKYTKTNFSLYESTLLNNRCYNYGGTRLLRTYYVKHFLPGAV